MQSSLYHSSRSTYILWYSHRFHHSKQSLFFFYMINVSVILQWLSRRNAFVTMKGCHVKLRLIETLQLHSVEGPNLHYAALFKGHHIYIVYPNYSLTPWETMYSRQEHVRLKKSTWGKNIEKSPGVAGCLFRQEPTYRVTSVLCDYVLLISN